MSDFNVQKAEFAAARFFETGTVRFCSAETAVETALSALELSACDEIIVAANIFSDISGYFEKNNIKAVPADVCKDSFSVLSADVMRKINNRTKAVVFSHAFGCPADIEALAAELAERKLPLVEECVSCAGAVRFSEGKIMRPGHFGIGCVIERKFALICAKDSAFADRLPQSDAFCAKNFIELQPDFEIINGRRRLAAARYIHLLAERNLYSDICMLPGDENSFSTIPVFPLLAKNRDALAECLAKSEIACSVPEFVYENTDCENFEALKQKLILLPAEDISAEQQEKIISMIAHFYRGQIR